MQLPSWWLFVVALFFVWISLNQAENVEIGIMVVFVFSPSRVCAEKELSLSVLAVHRLFIRVIDPSAYKRIQFSPESVVPTTQLSLAAWKGSRAYTLWESCYSRANTSLLPFNVSLVYIPLDGDSSHWQTNISTWVQSRGANIPPVIVLPTTPSGSLPIAAALNSYNAIVIAPYVPNNAGLYCASATCLQAGPEEIWNQRRFHRLFAVRTSRSKRRESVLNAFVGKNITILLVNRAPVAPFSTAEQIKRRSRLDGHNITEWNMSSMEFDASRLARDIRAYNPDLFMCHMNSTDTKKLLTTLEEMRWFPKAFAYHWDDSASQYELSSAIGSASAETEGLNWLGSPVDPVPINHVNYVDPICFPYSPQKSAVTRFQEAWAAQFPQGRSAYGEEAVAAFSSISVIFQALFRTQNSSVSAIYDALATGLGGGVFRTLVGPVEFGSVGENVGRGTPVAQLQYTSMPIVAPEIYAESQMYYPLFWNCRLPKPPGDNVFCDVALGVWYSLGNYEVGSNSTITIRIEVVQQINVLGNFTVSGGELVISRTTLINSTTCSFLSGSLTLDLTETELSVGTFTQTVVVSSLNCLSGRFDAINLQIPAGTCRKAEATPVYSSGGMSVLVSITTDVGCTQPISAENAVVPSWAIPVGVTLGVVVLVVAVTLAVIFVPCLANRLIPSKNFSNNLRFKMARKT